MYTVELDVLGQKWKIFLLEEDKYIHDHGDSNAAHTNVYDREVYFNDEELSLVNVKHETFHMFRAALCTHSASLTVDQEEEVSAELFAQHGDYMNRLARKLFKELLYEKQN